MDPLTVFFTGVFLMLQIAGTTGSMSRQYHFIDSPMSWTDALQYCRTNYADLASVDNMNEYHNLLTTIGATTENFIWIGLEKALTDWWIWSEGIGEVTVYEWDHPKHFGDCVIMKPTIYWFVNQCNEQRAFLCFDYGNDGKIEYVLHTTLKTWQSAQSFCRQHHVDLVSVSTDQQNRDVKESGQGNTIWIGLRRDNWMWSDESTTSFRNWVENYPENVNNYNCAMISVVDQYKWKDGACGASHPFVCYGDLKTKKTVIKVKIESEVNPNLPGVSELMLQQIQARLEERGATVLQVRWRAAEGEPIFDYKQDKGDEIKVDDCIT